MHFMHGIQDRTLRVDEAFSELSEESPHQPPPQFHQKRRFYEIHGY